jgi:hypothetical protein
VKDQMALQKLVEKIQKINTVSALVTTKKRLKVGVALFFVGLALLIIVTIFLAIKFPQVFGL